MPTTRHGRFRNHTGHGGEDAGREKRRVRLQEKPGEEARTGRAGNQIGENGPDASLGAVKAVDTVLIILYLSGML